MINGREAIVNPAAGDGNPAQPLHQTVDAGRCQRQRRIVGGLGSGNQARLPRQEGDGSVPQARQRRRGAGNRLTRSVQVFI